MPLLMREDGPDAAPDPLAKVSQTVPRFGLGQCSVRGVEVCSLLPC